MRLRMAMTAVWLMAFLAATTTCGWTPALAGGPDEDVDLHFVPHQRSEFAQVAAKLFRAEWGGEFGDAEKFELKVATFDLNDDGVEELFLLSEIGVHCGNPGCSVDVYQNINGTWQKIALLTGYGFTIWPKQHSNKGYRGISSSDFYYVWDGKAYRNHCAWPKALNRC